MAKLLRRRSLLFIFFYALIFNSVGLPGAVAVDSVVLSVYSATNACNWPSSNTYGTLFQAGTSSNITKMRIQYDAATSDANFNANRFLIYNNTGTASLGTLVGTLTPSSIASSVTLSGAFAATRTGTYVGSVPVVAGNKYWLQMQSNGSSISACQTATVVTQDSGWSQVKTSGNFQAIMNSGTFTYSTIFSYELSIDGVDTAPPTFTSSDTFAINENSTTIATVQASESSTISIFGGEDSSKFNLVRLSESSAALSFTSAPNFEIPSDAGFNNSYIVVMKALDSALNIGYETVTVTVIDIEDTSAINSVTFSSAPVFRSPLTITANISTPSRVTFSANGKRISGCIGRTTSGVSPNITATCTWKPANRGSLRISASATPTNTSVASSSSIPIIVLVTNRAGRR